MGSPQENQTLLETVEAALEDEGNTPNPLLPLLDALYQSHRQQVEDIDKLLHIADGFGSLKHINHLSLEQRYSKQIRRMEKIARISDLYQKRTVELNNELQRVATRDHLTGLLNRRGMEDRLKQESANVARTGVPLTLAMIDIDYFKAVNDDYGHSGGDQLLCAVSTAILSCLRPYDICARWGGEEFLLLLPGTTLAAAEQIALRILDAVSAIRLTRLGLETRGKVQQTLTISAGLAQLPAGFDASSRYESTISQADDALYQAKANGRNCVVKAPYQPAGAKA